VLTRSGLQVDLRVVAAEHLGAATLYFTGSKAHNIRLRQRALERGWTLNEYALTHAETGQVVASRTEQDIYRALELAWVPPPMREDTGEVELAAKGELPALVTLADLRGDLHCHTTLSGDGRSTLEEIVAGAAARGYEYLAITDHGEDLTINGVPRDRLLAQKDELVRVGERYPDLHLLHGCELNIGPDGGLDYDDETRAALDFCIAGVHSHFDLPQAKQTERIIKAMHDPSVKVIAHLTGRRIGHRPGIDLDADAIFEAAVETGTAIELNASLARLDAAADLIRRAPDGVLFTISTDCHHTRDQDRMRWGVEYSQRGWLAKDRVLNTRPLAALLER
jgi:DNA polymerase (family X)